MTYINLIYLARLTERVAIVGIFAPLHIGRDAPIIPFSEVFDISRFIEESGIPILEWSDVKQPDSVFVDEIGCWNVWGSSQYENDNSRPGLAPERLRLGEHPIPQIPRRKS